MKSPFEKYLQHANEFISEIAIVTGAPEDLDRAARIVASLFHALRERISPQESLQLIAQLPMLLKAVYVDGWKMTAKSHGGKTLDDFLFEIKAKYGPSAGSDLGSNHKTAIIMANVLGVLRNYVSDGEFEDIRRQLPEEIAELFRLTDVL